MKAVMISIQPKWVEKIASGEKTIEVRKTKPNLKTPFKCYIYCTKRGKQFFHGGIGEKEVLFRNSDTGKIKFDYAFEFMDCKNGYSADNFLSGKVIGEFVCDKIDEYAWVKSLLKISSETGLPSGSYNSYLIFDDDYEKMCLTYNEVKEYGNGRTLYGWHISDLKIYDEPKELIEFYKHCVNYKDLPAYEQLFYEQCQYSYNVNCFIKCRIDGKIPLTRPPQSWCYVKEEK